MSLIDLIGEGKLVRLFQYKHRLICKNQIYHITQRAPGKEPLFLEEVDYLYFLHLLKEVLKVYALEIFSFVLMPNHVHLLLRIIKENLSRAMKCLFQRYALYFNSKYQRKGHVFSGRFGSALCSGDDYLLAISIYIHINPIKAKLCKRLEDYRFSSVLPYIKDIGKRTFIKPEVVLSLVNENINKARQIYRNILEESLNLEYKSPFEDNFWLEDFRMGLLKIFNRASISFGLPIDLISLHKKIEAFKDRRLRKPEELKARKYLIEQLIARGYLVKEIAERLDITRQSIHRILKV